MLQQILKDMYIDPELLAELDETQKQTLFCRMREEQVRRWHLWDEDERNDPKSKIQQNTPKKSCKKKVQWLLNQEGEPSVVVIGEEMERKHSRMDYVETKGPEPHVKKEEEIYSEINQKTSVTSTYVVSSNVNNCATEKRGALTELSMNKAQKVSKRVAEWEERLVLDQKQSPSPPKCNDNVADVQNVVVVKTAQAEEKSDSGEEETKCEELWMEQKKKADEAETRWRTIARLAREEHRRSFTETNASEFKKKLAETTTMRRNISTILRDTKPPNREAIVDWFKREELVRTAVGSPAASPWFHGLIGRQEAECCLMNEAAGTFLVRISERIWGYVISYRDAGPSCKHYLVEANNGLYRFLGTDQMDHNSLRELIMHHMENPLTVTGKEILKYPCPRRNDVSQLFQKI